MTYLSDKRKRNTSSTIGIVALVCVLVITFTWGSVQPFLASIFSPVVSVYTTSKHGFFAVPRTVVSYFTSRHAYEEKIAALEEVIEKLENEKAILVRNGDTNEALYVRTAYPIIRDLTTLYETVRISRGFVDGIREGDSVYVRGRFGVGTIETVSRETSLMSLYSRGGRETRVVIPEQSAAFVVLGAGGGSFTAQVPKTVNVAVGTLLFLEEDPRTALGVVVQIDNDPQDVAMRLHIRGMYNPQEYQRLYIDSDE